jgi:DNA-binding transcriptional regulator YiaG
MQRAVTVCGGLAALAIALDVSAETLRNWLDGHATPPVDAYIKALDLVATGQHKRARG